MSMISAKEAQAETSKFLSQFDSTKFRERINDMISRKAKQGESAVILFPGDLNVPTQIWEDTKIELELLGFIVIQDRSIIIRW